MPSLLLAHAALVLLIGGLRFPEALDLVTQQSGEYSRWAMLTGVLFGLALLALKQDARRRVAPWQSVDRALLWWVLVVTPALLWQFGDLAIERGLDLVFLVLAAGAAGVWAWRRRGELHLWSWGPRAWLLQGALVPTLVAAGLLLVWRSRVGPPEVEASPGDWLLAGATYPLYAFFQLFLLLVMPAWQWRRDGHGVGIVGLGCTALFAMIHWPNPFLVIATAMGMLIWSRAWLAGLGLVPLALSMGLLGALVAQGLPTHTNGHVRVGPGYVIRLHTLRSIEAFDARVARLASDATYESSGGRPDPWLKALHLEAFGRSISPAVLEAWIERIEDEHRSRIVRIFFEGREYRRRLDFDRTLVDSDRLLLHSTFVADHPAHSPYDDLRSRASLVAGGGFEGFLVRCYEELLGRTPTAEEVQAWPTWPEARHRVEIVRLFLRAGGEEDPDLFRRGHEAPWWPDAQTPR